MLKSTNSPSDHRHPSIYSYDRLLLSVLFLFLAAGYSTAQTRYMVKWVNDGDTILLTNGLRVRYIGIDAPEIDHENQTAQPCGYQARTFNKKHVLSRKVGLEFDREHHDRYGRSLAYIFLADGSFLNERILEQGLAYYLHRRPNVKYGKRLLKAQQKAMKAQKGLWHNWKKMQGRYIGNRSSRRFHLDSCPQARTIRWKNRTIFHSKWDGFHAGYAPAKYCIMEFWSYK